MFSLAEQQQQQQQQQQQLGFWGFGRRLPQLDDLGIVSLVSQERQIVAVTRAGSVLQLLLTNQAESKEPQLVLVDTKAIAERGGGGGAATNRPVRIAASSDGQHYLLLTELGEVWAWGCADNGRLGLGSSSSEHQASPQLVGGPLLGRRVVRLAAGNNYSAAVTADGELFTWGQGAYGRLGHGGLEDVQLPTVVSALAGQRVVDVACGSGDAQTLAVTAEGLVYSWGDGDYGKLGRGGSDGSRVPRFVHNFIDNLENHD